MDIIKLTIIINTLLYLTFINNKSITEKTIYQGFYYCLYDSCSEELKKKFIEKNKLEPILYKNGVGLTIKFNTKFMELQKIN